MTPEHSSPSERNHSDTTAGAGDTNSAGSQADSSERAHGTSRRDILGAMGVGVAGLAVGGVGGTFYGEQRVENQQAKLAETTGANLIYDFNGEHQAGIVTPAQDRMHFAAFDLADDVEIDELVELMQDWTKAARRMVLGGEVSARGAFGGGELFPPDDSGEAVGLGPTGLTLTFGFGRSLFVTADGKDRFGLKSKMPKEFTELPTMVNDFMDPKRSDGDLCIQACANDPQVAVHAIRNLSRIAVGKAAIRWSQLGFGRTASTTADQQTPRNLFGQKDGTMNLKAEETDRLNENVWIPQDTSQTWTAGGSYLVARRIEMTIEVWDTVQLGEQERVTGRDKIEGAPLTGGTEFDEPDFSMTDERGRPVIDERSHVFRVHPDNNDGVRMLRRGYNFVDGNDAQGRLVAGLFFIAFVNDPARFARVHTNMSRDDMFIEYLKTTGSAVFLIPPGTTDDTYVGQGLLEG